MSIFRPILARVGGINGYLAQTNLSPFLVATCQTPDASAGNWTAASWDVFTVTGEVYVHAAFAVVDEALTGASTLAFGVSGTTGCLIASTTAAATNLDAVNDVWIGRSTASYARYNGEVDGGGVILSDCSVELTVSAASVTNGQLTFYILYTPISSDGLVEADTWA